MNTRYLIGTTLIVAGAVLALLIPDLTFLWFTGRPLGILLIAIGAFELGEKFFHERRSTTHPTDPR